jgi:hypothetical protein
MITFWLFISLSVIATIFTILAGIRTSKARKDMEYIHVHYTELTRMCKESDRSITECIILLKNLATSTEEVKKAIETTNILLNEDTSKND